MDPEPLQNVYFYPFNMDAVFYLITLCVLLIVSALISGSEVAFFSLKPVDLVELEADEKGKYQKLNVLLAKPRDLLATILIANNFVNITIIILSEYFLSSVFVLDQIDYRLSWVIKVVIVTFVLLLFGEILPKIYANKNALGFSQLMSKPMLFLRRIFGFLSKFLMATSSIIDKKVDKKGLPLSVDDLSHVLELTKETDTTKEEQKMLEGIAKFGNTDAKQIMTSRQDIIAIEITDTFKEVIDKILECGFSRIPVFHENLDTIKGVIYIKDLLPYLKYQSDFKWQIMIRDAFYIPESKKIDDLLKDFQSRKMHLSIVVDEYGGTSGIVSLEDILEEIVGDISDELDKDDMHYSKLDKFNYIFEGKTQLIDFYRVLQIDGNSFEQHKGEADTLAGFILEQAGKFLSKGEQIEFENYTFTIESIDERRINRIKVTIADEPNKDGIK